MSSRLSKPILPWPVLGLGIVVAAVAVVVAFVFGGVGKGNDGGGTSTPTLKPTPTLPPVAGTIGYVTPEGDFALVSPDGSNQQVLTDDSSVRSFVWAPDGSLAVLETETGIRALTLDGQEAFEVPGASQPLWSPDGSKLAVAQNGAVAVLDATGNSIARFESAVLPEWSPDGKSIAVVKVNGDGQALPVIGDLTTNGEIPLASDIAPAQPVFPIAWHPGGGVVAYGNRLYDLETGGTVDITGTAIDWSPDGRVLIAAGELVPQEQGWIGLVLDGSQGFQQTIGFIIRQSAEDIPPQLFLQRWIDWTPDGRYLFYMDPESFREAVRIYDTRPPVSQNRNSGIAGERPDISASARVDAAQLPEGALYGGLAVTFMYQGKVWVYPPDTVALVAVVDGSHPAWRPGP